MVTWQRLHVHPTQRVLPVGLGLGRAHQPGDHHVQQDGAARAAGADAAPEVVGAEPVPQGGGAADPSDATDVREGAAHMVHRQIAVDDVVLLDEAGHRQEILVDPPVGLQHALGGARRPRRVDDVRLVLQAQVQRGRGGVGDQLLVGQLGIAMDGHALRRVDVVVGAVGSVVDDQLRHSVELARHVVEPLDHHPLGDDRARPRVVELVGEQAALIAKVDRAEDRTRPPDGEHPEGADEGVEQEHRDPVALLDPGGSQVAGHGVHLG